MKVVVLGTGMIGGMMVRELAKCEAIDSVLAVDSVQESLDRCLAGCTDRKISGKVASLSEEGVMANILEGADLAIAALPHSLSVQANLAAIKSHCHMIDLVGSRFPEKAQLDEAAKAAGVLLVPGLGVAPGIANVLAARGIELMEEADEAQVYCGGLPRYPLPPLWYQVVFRLESVLGLYTRPGSAMINGEMVQLPALSALEECNFPEPVGECEAVITDAHSLGFTMKGRVKNLFEKTVRYKGHYAKVGVLAELGFFDEALVDVDGVKISPRRVSMAVLEPKLKGKNNEDITVLRVIVTGKREGKSARLQWEMIDLYDETRQLSSMAKTTGFPAVIAAEWIAQGKITEHGVVAPEQLLIGDRFDPFLAELKQRGINITFHNQ